ncbi:MAG: hypothetical protein K2M17_05140, partial [Bacilli bacterium]|nr:hypothetical protein [Bacilli bacterium]
QSSFVIKSGEPVRVIFKEENNNIDPLDLVRVVKFKKSKKERRIQWLNISSSLLGMEKAEKNGYLKFDGCKYGDSSYLLTIPAEELDKGEYGIIMGSGAESTVIPIVTFSVQ